MMLHMHAAETLINKLEAADAQPHHLTITVRDLSTAGTAPTGCATLHVLLSALNQTTHSIRHLHIAATFPH